MSHLWARDRLLPKLASRPITLRTASKVLVWNSRHRLPRYLLLNSTSCYRISTGKERAEGAFSWAERDAETDEDPKQHVTETILH